MKTINKLIVLAAILGMAHTVSNANNVQITSGITLTNQDTVNHSINVTFDVAWDNSWRDAINWDALWLFVKFNNGNAWQTCNLSTDKTDYSVGTNNGIVPAFSVGTTGSKAVGVFAFRSSVGAGSVKWQTLKMKWNYALSGLSDAQAASANIKAFAIEMVNVPTGTFSVGNGGTNSFYTNTYASTNNYATTSPSYIVNSENAISGNNVSYGIVGSYLSYLNATTNTNFTIKATFPKGYNAFYCMKYEITQEQYAEFLNSLQPAQQIARVSAITANMYMSDVANSTSPQYRNGICCKTAPTTSLAGVWGCDLNNNDIFNEVDDGQNIACNYISNSDALAYSDWSGLRPMTELEFEKASKGSENVANQYAWGTTNISAVKTIVNAGTANETSGTIGANAVYGNQTNVQGPMRVGCLATATSTRESSGASFYGIMELTGNLAEQSIPISYPNFDGTHGDGELYSNGNSDIANWISIGLGLRGCGWEWSILYLMTGDRSNATTPSSTGTRNVGFRCVRTAQ